MNLSVNLNMTNKTRHKDVANRRKEMNYVYRIKSTGFGENRYGKCERCGKPCNLHYKQQRQKAESNSKNWDTFGFGHIECLKNGNWANAEAFE